MKNLILSSSLVKVLIIIMAFLLPIQPLILIVGGCIVLDTIIGLWRAKKLKQPITSRKLSNVVSKMVLYEASIILFFVIEKFILFDFIHYFISMDLFLTKIVACVLVFIELQSMNESYTIINGYSLWDKMKEMLKRGKDFKGEIENFNK
jgi:multisubunit Na+/H+ antiporter MnhG subunit